MKCKTIRTMVHGEQEEFFRKIKALEKEGFHFEGNRSETITDEATFCTQLMAKREII